MANSKVYAVNYEEFCRLVATNYSYSDILRALNLGTKGGSSTDLLKNRIKELGCSTEHFNKHKSTKVVKLKQPLEDILVENSSYQNISRLKIRLVNEGVLEYRCALCGNEGRWQGKNLVLQLDHINGIHNDHRLCNLRFLCPNCHSQTDTYAGKNL